MDGMTLEKSGDKMKNKFDTLKIFIIIGSIVVLYSFLYLNGLKSKENKDTSVSFTERELQLSDEQYETFIVYLQLSGMKDKEKEKILSLKDIIADYNVLYDMLMADKFEKTTKWEGQAGQYKISGEYSSAERLMKELKGDDENIEWYIDDEYFVIVILGGCTDYNEYAISLQDARLFLQKDFIKRIS